MSCLILLILAVGSSLRSPVGRVSSRPLTVITLVLATLVMCSAANSLTSTTIVPPPGVSESIYIQALFLSNGFAAALLFLTVKICGEAGAALTPPSGGCLLGRVTCLPRRQVRLGLVTAAVWLAVCSVVYAWTNENGLTSVSLSQPDDFAAASAFPLAAPLLSSLVAAFQEEILFRWFALRYIASRTRSLALAITVTAVLWALIHANYRIIPPASRVIELVPLGIILSVLSLRYGVITAIVAHFAIDYITEALPLARIASPPETVILLVLLALPASICFIRWTRTPIDRLEKIEMTGSGSEPAKTDAHRRQLATRLPRSSEPTERRTSAITVRAACKVFDDITALHNVSCTMQCGKISCLLGPNGAGKTTLIHVVIGQETLTDGSVELRVQRTSPHHACAIGYVPDASLVYPLLTVREHLRLIEAVYQLSRFDMSNENDLLKRFGLERHANHLASKLSRGLKKRLMLACAVRQGASIIILDEPFDGLDPAGQDTLMKLLVDLRDTGRCVLVSTHRLDIAERIADALLVLSDGEVVFSGTGAQFARTGLPSPGKTAFEAAFAAVSTAGGRAPMAEWDGTST